MEESATPKTKMIRPVRLKLNLRASSVWGGGESYRENITLGALVSLHEFKLKRQVN